MERSTFLKSLAGVGATTLGMGSLSSFKSDVSTIDPDVMPSHITGMAPDFTKIRDDFPTG
jgi:hypothetical protein